MRDDGLGPFRGCVTALLLALALWAVLALVAWVVWSGTQKYADRKSAERVACQQSGGTVFDLTTGTVCLRLDGDSDE